MTAQDVLEFAESVAAKYSIDPNLITAFCMIESSANAYAVRYEPAYKYLLNPADYAKSLGLSLATETVLQMMSWGPMQIMGGVARELGFNGPLTQLTDPELALNLSCKHYLKFFAKYGSMQDAVSAYNQGSPRKDSNGKYINQDYVNKVMTKYKQLGALK